MVTEVAKTGQVKAFSSRHKEPVTIGKIDGPIRINPILSHGKPAIILPASLARYFGFSHNWDWLALDAEIVERGILLTIVNRNADIENGSSCITAALEKGAK